MPRQTDGVALICKYFGISAGRSRSTTDEYRDYQKDDDISFDFRFNYYGRSICFDVYYQKLDGLYLESKSPGNKIKNPDGTCPYYDSMDLSNLSASIYYAFSWKTFSMKAPYDLVDIQKKSAGSFLVMYNAGMLTVDDSSSILREETGETEVRISGLKKCTTYYTSISPGYSRTFVFMDHFFSNILLFCGIGADRTVYYAKGGKFDVTNYFPRLNIRSALGYSTDTCFFGMSLNIDEQILSMKDFTDTGDRPDISIKHYDSKIYAGYRFLD